MAKTKATAKQLRDQTVDELRAKEKELAQQLFALRLNKSTGQLESPAKVRAARRERARVLTVLGERTT
ncbi:MAG TPA: 50S ribosomal protein L29 [Thermoanaerobaculia bacterium]|jgi:large subunit ribosomal protein L29|nr:50S ribosomal protein L29 [Thermoanaerobaculia bacterium]